jgi:CRP/FNR family transcriptional regulator, putaive post-exponential-phase nitrogen-starvation regulator
MTVKKLTNEDIEVMKKYGIDPKVFHNCGICDFKSGDTIYRQGTTVKNLYIILKGKIKVCILAPNGRDMTLSYYLSSGILGDVELLLDEKAASTTAVVELPSECIEIPLESNASLLTGNIYFMNEVARGLSRKLLKNSNALVSSALYSGEERLCAYILMSENNGMFTGVLADIPKSIGISYRHLFRILNNLCRKNVLLKSKSGFQIIDRDYLIKKSRAEISKN